MSEQFSNVSMDEDSLSEDGSSKVSPDFDSNYKFEYVPTECGHMYVAFSKSFDAGQKLSKPVLVTFHDVGFNFRTSYEQFFQFNKMSSILSNFYVLHLNAPGQEMFAKTMFYKSNDASASPYPTIDQIARSIGQVAEHFLISEFVAFGVGAGANILARFALLQPNMVNGLFLVNPSFNRSSLTDKLKGRALIKILTMESGSKMSQMMRKFSLGQYFSGSAVPLPMLAQYISRRTRPHYLHPAFNAHNFGLFLESCLNRPKITLQRQTKSNISCPVLLITSENSSSMEETMKMAAELNPANSSYIKVQSSKDAMRDKPKSVADAFQLFLQGLGYIGSYCLEGLQGDEISVE